MKPFGQSFIARFALVLVALTGALSTSGLTTSGAQFSDTTSNAANHVRAIEVAPPPSINGSLGFTLLLACRAQLNWTASPTPGVTSYQVRRVRVSDNAVLRTVVENDTDFEEILPAALLSQTVRWEVRSILGGFYSAPITITRSASLLCLL